jgi:hypothetical protein
VARGTNLGYRHSIMGAQGLGGVARIRRDDVGVSGQAGKDARGWWRDGKSRAGGSAAVGRCAASILKVLAVFAGDGILVSGGCSVLFLFLFWPGPGWVLAIAGKGRVGVMKDGGPGMLGGSVDVKTCGRFASSWLWSLVSVGHSLSSRRSLSTECRGADGRGEQESRALPCSLPGHGPLHLGFFLSLSLFF